ncbi:Glycine-rich protein 5 [Cardamine amara subsp. amara]|uniref:Glycine-rich protein 5 n=1 Tax=Cardamine amara subsp. amara TaxID=228776 RepID=A0ABD0Z4R7_CARAN
MASKSLFFVALLIGSLAFTSFASVANRKLKSGLKDEKTFFHHHGGHGGGRGLGEGAGGGGAGGGYSGGAGGGSWFGGGAGSDINGRCGGGLP